MLKPKKNYPVRVLIHYDWSSWGVVGLEVGGEGGLIKFNAVFTEVVPTVGGKRELISNRYTVATRMISALRLQRCEPFYCFIKCAGQSHETETINHIS